MAEQMGNSEWNNGTNSSEIGVVNLMNDFENHFSSASNNTMISYSTVSGVEGGIIMNKQTSEKVNYGMLFSKKLGVCAVMRATNGTWYYKKVVLHT